MDFNSIIIIALVLAIDAFAVALGAGVSLDRVGLRRTFRLAWHFGFFQGAMNIIGWSAGLTFRQLFAAVDHWVAFGILVFVGLNMVREAVNDHPDMSKADPSKGFTLVMLSIATSIDSLAVGLTFAILETNIWLPALIIGITATFLTAAGLHLGRLISSTSRLGTKAEIGGGLVLIALGFKILYDHGVFLTF